MSAEVLRTRTRGIGGSYPGLYLQRISVLALDGIEEWSHIYVIFWMDRVATNGELRLHHPRSGVGIFSTRAPIQANPIGLTLVELVDHKAGVIWVRGLDALDGTPILDIKPYPDWEHGHLQVVVDFKIP